jgi:hypothetical protein
MQCARRKRNQRVLSKGLERVSAILNPGRVMEVFEKGMEDSGKLGSVWVLVVVLFVWGLFLSETTE